MHNQMVALTSLSLSPPREKKPVRVKADRAAWGVGGKGFFDDKCKFWVNGSALYWDHEPNLDLYPLNLIAWEKLQEYMDKLDSHGVKMAKKNGKEYIPLVRTEWREDGEYDEIPMPDSVMGAKIHGENEAIR